jgi:hypothetical protein
MLSYSLLLLLLLNLSLICLLIILSNWLLLSLWSYSILLNSLSLLLTI